MEFILSLITPVLLHMAVSVIVTAAGGAIGGAAADSAVCTSVTALLVLPVLIWMYRSDAAKGMHSNKSICRFDGAQHEERRSQNMQGTAAAKTNRTEKNGKRGKGIRQTAYLIGILVLCAISGGVLNLFWSGILAAASNSGSFFLMRCRSSCLPDRRWYSCSDWGCLCRWLRS